MNRNRKVKSKMVTPGEGKGKWAKGKVRSLILTVYLLLLTCLAVSAQTTEFSYQGLLKASGAPATGNYDFEFKLFDAASGGAQVGSTVQRLNVAVANGVYAVSLDFGAGGLTGADRYLDIAVRTAGGGTFTQLAPRQKITSVPYAVKSTNSTNADTAINAATATNATQLGGVAASQYVVTTDPRMSDARSPLSGSDNYIQNRTTQQPGNFNIAGNGIIGGNFGIGTSTPTYPLTVNGAAGSGAFQGVVEFSSSTSDTGVRIRNTASSGRTYTLFSSGGGSGIGAGNLNIYDATANQSRLTIAPNGSVGIGTTSPTFPLSFANIVGDKISLAPNGAASYGFGVQSLLLQVHTDISASDIAFGYGSSSAFTENMRIKGDGNVGIGTASPGQRLSVSDGMDIDHNGLNSGTLANTLRFGAGNSGEAIGSKRTAGGNQFGMDFYTASSNRMSITVGGNVGIGTTAPAATLEVNGYTKLGSDAPAIRIMKLTGTTAATEGGFVLITHGLDPAKILSVSVLVNSTFWWIPPNDTGGGGRYSWLLNGNRIEIFNAYGDSAQILSKPMRITIVYEQ